MAMVEREEVSHGSTPRVAKVELSFSSVEAMIEGRAVEWSCTWPLAPSWSALPVSVAFLALILDPVSNAVAVGLVWYDSPSSDAGVAAIEAFSPLESLPEPCVSDSETLRLFRAGSIPWRVVLASRIVSRFLR